MLQVWAAKLAADLHCELLVRQTGEIARTEKWSAFVSVADGAGIEVVALITSLPG